MSSYTFYVLCAETQQNNPPLLCCNCIVSSPCNVSRAYSDPLFVVRLSIVNNQLLVSCSDPLGVKRRDE
jgi:hypothetical protein